MKEYAIYLRKSRADMEAEARGEGETLARHRTALMKLANDRGYHIAEIYAEVVSGDTIAARPQMQALLAAVQRGEYAGVICNVGSIYAKAKKHKKRSRVSPAICLYAVTCPAPADRPRWSAGTAPPLWLRRTERRPNLRLRCPPAHRRTYPRRSERRFSAPGCPPL